MRPLLVVLLTLMLLAPPLLLATAGAQDAGDEILLDVGYSWRLTGGSVSGMLSNDDRAAITGTAKITAHAVTLTRTKAFSVPVDGHQNLSLPLTKAGRRFFRHRSRTSAELVVKETTGDARSGDVSSEIRVRRP